MESCCIKSIPLPVLKTIRDIEFNAVVESATTQDPLQLQTWVHNLRVFDIRGVAMFVPVRSYIFCRIWVNLFMKRVIVVASIETV